MRRLFVLTTSCVAIAAACAPDTANSGSGGGKGSGGSSHSAGGGSGVDGGQVVGAIDGGGGGGDFVVDTKPEGGGPLTADGACNQTFLKPESVEVEKKIEVPIKCKAAVPQPIALYIVLDNSGSMKDNSKWTNAVAAITAFVQGNGATPGAAWTCVDKEGKSVTPPPDLAPPGAGTISVGIQYFHPVGVQNPNECDGSAHSIPAVPVGTIPANAPAIVSSLASTGPNDDTPTVGALTGGINYCLAYQPQNPDTKCVVVLVTDGQPNGCGLSSRCPDGSQRCVDPDSAGVLTPIAADAFNRSGNSVTTFTVAMEGVSAEGFTLLDAVAVAGGSDCTPGSPGAETCNVTTSGTQGFIDALNSIRSTVQVSQNSTQEFTTTVTQTTTLPCEWTIPDPPPGKTFDKNLVNVAIDNAGTVSDVGNVATEGDCAGTGDGWYYDDPSKPTRILACPDTCNTLKNTADIAVQVLFGCATKIAIPR